MDIIDDKMVVYYILPLRMCFFQSKKAFFLVSNQNPSVFIMGKLVQLDRCNSIEEKIYTHISNHRKEFS